MSSPDNSSALSSQDEIDRYFMQRAIQQAHRCSSVSSAYSVGAVLVRRKMVSQQRQEAGHSWINDWEMISEGFSREIEGNTHAEECCILKAQDILTRSAHNNKAHPFTIYTTMEPCSKRLSGNK